MMTQAVGTACIPKDPAVEMPLYEFLSHELFDEQFLFLSPWKASKLRVDFSFQPSYTVLLLGQPQQGWHLARHVGISAVPRYWHPSECNERRGTELKRNFLLDCTVILRSGEKKTFNTSAFSFLERNLSYPTLFVLD